MAAANASTAWPDGRLEYSTFQPNGRYTSGPAVPSTNGRARPTRRLAIVNTSPGRPIAKNRKPSRTVNAARTPRDIRESEGVARHATSASAATIGNKNQTDLPKPVTYSKITIIDLGACCAALTAGASNMAILAA